MNPFIIKEAAAYGDSNMLQTHKSICSKITELTLGLESMKLRREDVVLFTNLETLHVEIEDAYMNGFLFEFFAELKKLKTLQLFIWYGEGAEIPGSIRHLTSLEKLVLDDCNLKKVDLSILSKLPTLKELSLKGCVLEELPLSLEALTSLQSLDLSPWYYPDETGMYMSNDFSNAGLSVLRGLQKLEYLNLSGTNLSSIPNKISHLASLKNLLLSNNDLSNADFTPLRSCEQLESLVLNKCCLTDFTDVLGELSGLRQVSAYGNEFSNASFSVFYKMGSLQTLDISSCALKMLPQSMAGLHGLENLHIGFNEFPGSNFSPLENLPIKVLHIGSTQITGNDIPESIQKLKQLQTLNISRNKFKKYTALPGIRAFSKLKKLDVGMLYDLDISSLSSLKDLEHLSMEGLGSGKLDLTPLTRLKKLRSLKLRPFDACEILSGPFGELSVLEELDMSESNIDNLYELPFHKLKALRKLNLNSSWLIEWPKNLMDMPALEGLIFGSETYTYENTNHLKHLPDLSVGFPSLRHLDLTDCQITHLPPGIRDLPKLETLIVRKADLQEEELSELEGSKLKRLTLTRFNFSKFPSVLKSLKYLEKLNINDEGFEIE